MSTSTIDPITDVADVRVSVRGLDDHATVGAGGTRLSSGIDGVEIKRITPHLDPRGILVEIINFDDPFWREPIVYSYSITVNPGRIKGWGMHLRQTDRHYVHNGNVRFILFDAREDSPTHGQVAQASFGNESRGLVRIPPGVWHAAQAWGDEPAHITNFPTIPYDHANPDKQTLPIGAPEIPFDFGDLDAYVR